MNRLRVLLILYRQTLGFTLLTSLLIWWVVRYPTLSELPYYLPALFWGRAFVQGMGWGLMWTLNKGPNVFAYHFGFSPVRVVVSVFLLDSLLLVSWISVFSLVVL